MSAWRRKAVERFPELGRALSDPREIASIYSLWFELLPRAKEAHRDRNDEVLRRIYDYAEWCDRQGGELANAAGVAFYEHLFDEPWMRTLVVPWLSPQIVGDIHPLWEARLSPEDMREIDELFRNR